MNATVAQLINEQINKEFYTQTAVFRLHRLKHV